MAKKKQYVCSQCSAVHPKWSGQCAECGEWNSLEEQVSMSLPHHKKSASRAVGFSGTKSQMQSLQEIKDVYEIRHTTGVGEFDRVLGGGLVAGSVVLIGGDPGIGKSTLLLQVAAHMGSPDTASASALYVTGEESLAQVASRAKRLGLIHSNLNVLAQTEVSMICQVLSEQSPAVAVIDSVQTLYSEQVSSAPGSVSQVRETAAMLTRFAKRTGTSLFLVGHVTKDGALAGPRVVEHMVDAVLYFEGQSDSRYRMIRAIKNRFGAVNELGVFSMGESGLKEVTNPSAIFLNRQELQAPGTLVAPIKEGTRTILVETQALVDTAQGQARRYALGLEAARISMLLAVLSRHGKTSMQSSDVYFNVVGGVKITETAADLAVILACASSKKGVALSQNLAVFGEVGLSGELRPVPAAMERITEAAKHGFSLIIAPKGNLNKQQTKGVVTQQISGAKVIGVETVAQALEAAGLNQ